MALCETHFTILRILVERGILQRGKSLLQIGRVNFYNDFPLTRALPAIEANEEPFRSELRERLDKATEEPLPDCLWTIADVIYDSVFHPSETVAIDMNGPGVLKLDLNEPIDLGRQFGVVLNNGTAEHIFNISGVFRTMHRHCEVGGLMIHEMPFSGWLDHGFFNCQPTLFYDLAAANGYEIEYMAAEDVKYKLIFETRTRAGIHDLAKAGKLPDNALLFVVLRRQNADEFRIPAQGYYSRALSAGENLAWRTMR